MSHVQRALKRSVLVTLLAMVLGATALPSASMASPLALGIGVIRPADGVGDSPLVP